MASWLFTQYLLTNQVQTAYARTEGYVPVTSMAQDSAEYQDYLSRAGEDDDDFYKIKIQASRLLLSNTGNTFVTPVFNGSASLRDAAGQLIESVTKSVRRKETVDDAYMDRLFDDVASLYHLNEVKAQTSGKTDLGALPWTARVLIGGLILSWVLILLWAFRDILKKRTQNH